MSDGEYKHANRVFVKTLLKVHLEFADAVEQIWKVFMKDMETQNPRA